MTKYTTFFLILLGVVGGGSVGFAQSALQIEQTTVVNTQTNTLRLEASGNGQMEASGVVGQTFVLDGTRSTDDGVVRTYTWTQVSGPFKFSAQEGAVLTIVPSVAGTYVFELVVTDRAGTPTTEVKATVNVSESPEKKKGNVEINWKVEEGQKGVPEDSDRIVQNNQTNLEFLRARMSTAIVVNKVTVRGWDPEKKQEFLGTVKAAAELRSDQELEHFAQGVLLDDENVNSISIDEPGVHVTYAMPAKFLGIFNSSLSLNTDVDADGRVKVKFPWYRFLFRTSVDTSAMQQEISAKIDAVKTEINAKIDARASADMDVTFEGTAQTIEAIITINKVFHESAKSIIQNIRA